jgi:DNA-binding MarR family transcriptional regulator
MSSQTAPGESLPPLERIEPAAAVQGREAQMLELGRAFRGVVRGYMSLRGRDTHLGAGELSHAQFQLLIELHERGELPAGELACAAQLAPATVTQMLDHLAACGHVERARSGADRRVVVSRLTPRGRRRVRARRDAWRRRWERALAGIDERDLRAATLVLERLCAVFGEEPSGDGGRASRARSPATSHGK